MIYELRTPDGRRVKVDAKSRGNAIKLGEIKSGCRVEIIDNIKIKNYERYKNNFKNIYPTSKPDTFD